MDSTNKPDLIAIATVLATAGTPDAVIGHIAGGPRAASAR
jgi:hypothetical protein